MMKIIFYLANWGASLATVMVLGMINAVSSPGDDFVLWIMLTIVGMQFCIMRGCWRYFRHPESGQKTWRTYIGFFPILPLFLVTLTILPKLLWYKYRIVQLAFKQTQIKAHPEDYVRITNYQESFITVLKIDKPIGVNIRFHLEQHFAMPWKDCLMDPVVLWPEPSSSRQNVALTLDEARKHRFDFWVNHPHLTAQTGVLHANFGNCRNFSSENAGIDVEFSLFPNPNRISPVIAKNGKQQICLPAEGPNSGRIPLVGNSVSELTRTQQAPPTLARWFHIYQDKILVDLSPVLTSLIRSESKILNDYFTWQKIFQINWTKELSRAGYLACRPFLESANLGIEGTKNCFCLKVPFALENKPANF